MNLIRKNIFLRCEQTTTNKSRKIKPFIFTLVQLFDHSHTKDIISYHEIEHLQPLTQYLLKQVYRVEEDTCQIRVVNEQKLESQLASLNKEATFIDNRYSDGEIENANPIGDIEKEVNPKSLTKQKLVIHDDSKFDEEEAKGIEEMTKIKLLNSATDCMCSKLTNFITFSQTHFALGP